MRWITVFVWEKTTLGRLDMCCASIWLASIFVYQVFLTTGGYWSSHTPFAIRICDCGCLCFVDQRCEYQDVHAIECIPAVSNCFCEPCFIERGRVLSATREPLPKKKNDERIRKLALGGLCAVELLPWFVCSCPGQVKHEESNRTGLPASSTE